MIRQGTRVRTTEGVTGTVVAVVTLDRYVRTDRDRLFTVRTDDDRELKFWGWQLRRDTATPARRSSTR